MVIAADWRSTATVARWRLSPWKWWEASYRLTEIVRLDGFGDVDDELYALREGRSLAEDEGMEKGSAGTERNGLRHHLHQSARCRSKTRHE